MKKLLFLFLFLFSLIPTLAFSQPVHEYWETTNNSKTVAWDRPSDWKMGDQYEVKRILLEAPTIEIPTAIVSVFQIVVSPIRVGHYDIQVRTKRRDTVNNIDLYSIWVSSTDPAYAVVDGTPMGWRLYWYLASPGQIIIGQNYNLNLIGGENNGFSERKNSHLGGKSVSRRNWLQSVFQTERYSYI